MFFDGWFGLLRVLVVGVLAYIALIALLRVSGKRTLSKMSAFDLVVTVALGSTLATILVSKQVALAEGVLAFAVLIGLQYVIAWSSVRSGFVCRLVKSQPRLLLHRGRFIDDAMKDQRVTESEVRAAVRAGGAGSLAEVEAVVLEADGGLSVVLKPVAAHASALSDVRDTGGDPGRGPA